MENGTFARQKSYISKALVWSKGLKYFITPTNLTPSSQWGKTFCFLFLRENLKKKKWPTLYNETLIELLHADIVLKRYYA